MNYLILYEILKGIGTAISKTADKFLDLLKILVPLIWKFLIQTKSLLWFLVIWTFFFSLTSVIMSFTLYHISSSLQYFLAMFCTAFTVSLIVKSVIAMFIFSIGFFFKKLI